MVTSGQAKRFGKLCEESRRISAVVHTHPDGDALGCSMGMCSYLSLVMGKDVAVVVPDGIPDSLGFLCAGVPLIDASSGFEAAAARIASSDLLLVMDMNSFGRASALEPLLSASGARKVLVDHHLDPDRESFDLVFSETEVSSASELTYWLLRELSTAPLPMQTMRALMTGMTTDTNNFANSVWPSTLRMSSELLEAGVDRDEILSYLYNNGRENRLRALGFILAEKMHISPEGVSCIVLSLADQERFSLLDGETEGFVNLPLSIGRVRMSLLLKEDAGAFMRVSIRSKKGISANAFARLYFHGGGHENAAGGRLTFPADIAGAAEAENYVMEAAARFMKNE